MTISKEQPRISPLAFSGFCMLCVFLIFSKNVIAWIQKSLLLCATTIIPTLFPYMVACDMLMASDILRSQHTSKIDGACRFLLGTPASGLLAFVLGALCGFPIGTKIAADLYKGKHINIREAENLLCFSNNTSPAFLIAGVGISLFGSLKIGIILYVFQLISALLSGVLFSRLPHRQKSKLLAAEALASTHDTGFVSAVRRSVTNVLFVCGFVVLFSSFCGILSSFIENQDLLAFIYSFLEVGGGCAMAASIYAVSPLWAILCATVAVNFAGMSVHLQAASFLRGVPFSFSRYMTAKATQAFFAILLTFLFLPFF